jgi:hypothetical protein
MKTFKQCIILEEVHAEVILNVALDVAIMALVLL